MKETEPVTHHSTIRCSTRGNVRRTANWDWVTCEDCWDKRESNKKWAVWAGLAFAGLFFLLFLSCLAIAI